MPLTLGRNGHFYLHLASHNCVTLPAQTLVEAEKLSIYLGTLMFQTKSAFLKEKKKKIGAYIVYKLESSAIAGACMKEKWI